MTTCPICRGVYLDGERHRCANPAWSADLVAVLAVGGILAAGGAVLVALALGGLAALLVGGPVLATFAIVAYRWSRRGR